MSKLNSDEINKRENLRSLMATELFKEAVFDVKRSIADEMLRTNDVATRERLYCMGQTLDRVVNTLTEYTNELLFLEQKLKEEAA